MLVLSAIKKMTDDAEPTTVGRETERRDQNAGEENSQHNRNDVQHNRLWNNRTDSGSTEETKTKTGSDHV